MKKRNLKSLTLNKHKISELQIETRGGRQAASDDCTKSGCSCVSCRPGSCQVQAATQNYGQ